MRKFLQAPSVLFQRHIDENTPETYSGAVLISYSPVTLLRLNGIRNGFIFVPHGITVRVIEVDRHVMLRSREAG